MKQQYTHKEIAARLLHDYVKPYKGRIMIAVICMALVAAATAMNAWLMQPILDDIFIKKNKRMLMIVPFIVLVIALVKAVAAYIQMVILRTVGQRVTIDVQKDTYAHVIHADVAHFANTSSGALISRFSNDVVVLRQNLTQILVGSVRETLTVICLIAVMLYQSVSLTIIALVIVPLAVFPVAKVGRRMRKIAHQTQHNLAGFTNQLEESFTANTLVKAYSREDHEIQKSAAQLEGLYGLFYKAARVASIVSPLMEALGGIAIAAVIYWGGVQVFNGETTAGAFFSFVTALLMIYRPMKNLSTLTTKWNEMMASLERLYSMHDTKPNVVEATNPKPLPKAGDIAFENMQFSYGDSVVLDNIDLTIKQGHKVALVGASGSGKTTMLSLLLRFYDPVKGTITIDNTDIKQVRFADLRHLIGYVSQEATLLNDTIKNNILYGKLDASDADVEQAAKQAFAHEFIVEQPQGYDTVVGQAGGNLSGGQRQRIAIARAMLKNAPILLLDEATSALDTVSEKKVQQALEVLMKNRTTIMVAHRLSTVQAADEIIVLERGKIIERGTHESLLAQKGAYKKLYSQQLS